MAHEIQIKGSAFYVQGNDTQTLKELCEILKLKYNKLEKSKLSESQNILKIWKIGELADYINAQTK